jgi:plastocyanin
MTNVASRLTLAILLAATTIACSGSSTSNTPGTGGGGGGSSGGGATGAGTAGAAGTGSGGSGGATGAGGSGAGFMAFAPCNAAGDYVAGTTINFGGSVGFNYDPKCLKVTAGATVTFNGDFSVHPLAPSAARGNTTDNPIVNMSAGTTASFAFPTRGFFAYLCNFHGSDDGAFMSGVIWVQ